MRKIIFIYFFLAAISLFSLGKREKGNGSQYDNHSKLSDAGTENTIKILGQIQVFGSEPHTFAGIIDENGIEYAVYPPSTEEELRKFQGHLIEFTVVLLGEPQGYGSLFLKGGTVTPVRWRIVIPNPPP
jgi:hypothetical protein